MAALVVVRKHFKKLTYTSRLTEGLLEVTNLQNDTSLSWLGGKLLWQLELLLTWGSFQHSARLLLLLLSSSSCSPSINIALSGVESRFARSLLPGSFAFQYVYTNFICDRSHLLVFSHFHCTFCHFFCRKYFSLFRFSFFFSFVFRFSVFICLNDFFTQYLSSTL